MGFVAPPVASAQGANPVLVVGGFDADPAKQESLRGWLEARGYAAYSMLLRGNPTGAAPIAESAQAIADEVAAIRVRTGAERVDLVGHSMGGLAQRQYVKFLDGAGQVGTYVDYGTPEFGEPLGFLCYAIHAGCRDLSPGSPFLQQLNADPAVPPGLPAYHLYTEDNPPERGHLPGATNASVQSFCPGRPLSHGDEPLDGALRELIDAALHGRPLATTCP
ncbi:triacylglycerol lipase [Nocardia sp. BMG51109]|uniref:esterase/lipase family protein n=1 Tax=Nocardia sp. BMG51109 TaxID=1056816 RepID=UPI0004B28D0E|nr:alpha/beta hydrolase [Nocardia sp. BMG51109]